MTILKEFSRTLVLTESTIKNNKAFEGENFHGFLANCVNVLYKSQKLYCS